MSDVTGPVPNLREILRAGWGTTAVVDIHPLGVRWFTGKVLARCDTADGSWCLAGAPEVYRKRVSTGATHQSRLISAGCGVIPQIKTTVNGGLLHQAEGRIWTLTSWERGASIHDQDRWTGPMLEQLGRAVGELHRLGRNVVPHGAAPQQTPNQFWAADWSSFDDWARDRWQLLLADQDVCRSHELAPLRDVVALGIDSLRSMARARVRHLTVTHGDLWTEHVLFTNSGRLAAIIDLDGLDVGDGHGDLAALLSDFANLEPHRCAPVVRGYGSECPVTHEDLAATGATIARHHLLTLLERIRLWQEHHDRREDLISRTIYWQRSLRAVVDLDTSDWTNAIMTAVAKGGRGT